MPFEQIKAQEDYLLTSIKEAVEKYAKESAEEIIKQAVLEFEKEVRKNVGQVVLKLLTFYSAERLGNEILIHVKIGK